MKSVVEKWDDFKFKNRLPRETSPVAFELFAYDMDFLFDNVSQFDVWNWDSRMQPQTIKILQKFIAKFGSDDYEWP